jgi:hypothetical protein
MTETRTAYLGLPLYSSDLDETLTRGDWNETTNNLEARLGYEDGSTASSLPVTLLKPGRYFRLSYVDGYSIQRRSASAWEHVGGTVIPVRQRFRGAAGTDVMLSTDAGGSDTATLTAGGDLATTGVVRALTGAMGADLTATLTPATTGRLYVRTRATGERGLVLSAHASDAGPLLTALESGGSATVQIDGLGRFRTSVPASFGGAAPAANIPMASAAGATDLTALDLYGATTGPRPGLRVYRDLGDAATEILSVLPDVIRLGRTSWAGGLIDLKAPATTVSGTLGVTGALSGSSATLSAGLAVGGALTAATAAVAGALTSYGGLIPLIEPATAPVTAPVTNQLVLVTTNNIWYRWDGAAWVESAPQRGGTTAATRHEAHYTKSTPQNITSGSGITTDIKFETSDYASDDVTASGTGNVAFTLNRAGLWTVAVSTTWSGASAGRRAVYISNDNFTQVFKANSAWPDNAGACPVSVSDTFRVAAGQIIRIKVIQDSGTTTPIDNASQQTNVSFAWLGA